MAIVYDEFNRKHFEGTFKKNLANGTGVLYYTQNFNQVKCRYEGQFKNGLYHGYGVLNDYAGKFVLYKGNFFNGEKHG